MALPAVEIEDTDLPGVAHALGAVDVAHHLERCAQYVADTQCDRAFVVRGDACVVQILHELSASGPKDLVWDLPARLELAARHRGAISAATTPELQLAVAGHEHDETALGSRDLDRRVEHELEHVVQHLRVTQRAEPREERGGLAQVADRGR